MHVIFFFFSPKEENKDIYAMKGIEERKRERKRGGNESKYEARIRSLISSAMFRR